MNLILFLSTLLSFGYSLNALKTARKGPLNPDTGLNIIQYVTKYGYPIESHTVQTEDGYILTLHRIPHGIKDTHTDSTVRPAVLLMHGIVSNSIDWLNVGTNSSLGFLLADRGYDVWMGNQRGNTWSRNHTTLDPDVNITEFWDFSFHEIGVYDLPAMIDYILKNVNQEKLHYVAHSQGTSAFFAMASVRPEYNKKIKLMTALAPVAFLGNATSIFLQLGAKYYPILKLAVNHYKIHEILRHTEFITKVVEDICYIGSEYENLCADLLYFIGGNDPNEMNEDLITVFLSNTPAGASANQFLHFAQEKASGKFRQFDYGIAGNLAKYGHMSPPDYNLKNIVAPISLHYSKADPFSSYINVEELADILPNVVSKKLVALETFSHLDFMWATHVRTLVNDDVLSLISKF